MKGDKYNHALKLRFRILMMFLVEFFLYGTINLSPLTGKYNRLYRKLWCIKIFKCKNFLISIKPIVIFVSEFTPINVFYCC